MPVRYRTLKDGRVAREAEIWTEEKLRILECYLPSFLKATTTARERYALDLFAGTGMNWSKTRGSPLPGSPLIALEAGPPRFTRVVASEADHDLMQALQARCAPYASRAELVEGDANGRIFELLEHVPQRAPAFAFLDPEGADLAWPTVERLARHREGPRKIEQLILFPVDMGFVRLLDREQVNEAGARRVARIYGHENFREIWEARASGRISADEARTRYVQMYADGLRGLGYRTVLDRQIRSGQRRPLYFLVFATDHDAGERIMDHCFDNVRLSLEEELGQGTLFEMPRTPRRRRIT